MESKFKMSCTGRSEEFRETTLLWECLERLLWFVFVYMRQAGFHRLGGFGFVERKYRQKSEEAGRGGR